MDNKERKWVNFPINNYKSFVAWTTGQRSIYVNYKSTFLLGNIGEIKGCRLIKQFILSLLFLRFTAKRNLLKWLEINNNGSSFSFLCLLMNYYLLCSYNVNNMTMAIIENS